MSYEIQKLLDKQVNQIKMLEEELESAIIALEEKTVFAAGLEQDLEHAIRQLHDKAIDRQTSH